MPRRIDSGGSSSTSSNGSKENMDTTNFINTFLEKSFDNEYYAKFKQVLEFLGDEHKMLVTGYNNSLRTQFSKIPSYRDAFDQSEIRSTTFITLKVKFYAFRFISDIGSHVISRLDTGDVKAQHHFLTITKMLVYHALTSKSETGCLALAEIDQLCYKRKMNRQQLYINHKSKFLRLIIKAVLHKLMTNCDNEHMLVDNGSNNVDRSSWSTSINQVIIYMTRALDVFSEATVTREDVAQSLIIITNLIHKEKYDSAIKIFLDSIASFQNIDLHTLVRSDLHTIVVHLLLKKKLSYFDITQSLTKLCAFCDKTIKEMLATKFSVIKGLLLLNYSVDSKAVKEGVYYLSKFEKEESDQPFEDEFDDNPAFIEYLKPSMIGILLAMDSHFSSIRDKLCSDDALRCIESICQLLSLIDARNVQCIHVKILSTLSLLMHLRPRRDHQILNRSLAKLWKVFVEKLTKDLKASLLLNICITLYELVEDSPEEVGPIYNMLISSDESDDQLDKLPSLFFLPDIEALREVNARLSMYVSRETKASDLSNVKRQFDAILPLMKLESETSRMIAINKIKQLLQTNQNLLLDSMLINPEMPVDCILTKVIESILSLSSTQDSGCMSIIAECLGILGAVNPVRIFKITSSSVAERRIINPDLFGPEYIANLIERLKNSLFSDRRSESESANFALQVVVKNYQVLTNDSIKKQLSIQAIRACNLCKDTNYSGVRTTQPDKSGSVFARLKSENQYSYNEWLDKFVLNLVSGIKDNKIREVLYSCSYVFKYNQSLAEHILPYTIIYIITNQESIISMIRSEIIEILNEDTTASTQDLNTVHSENITSSVQTLHLQCAHMIFCALDEMKRYTNALRRARFLLKHGIPSQLPEVTMNRNYKYVTDFMTSLPKDKLALLAVKCRSHARALCYIEQHLLESKDSFDKHATALQRICVALDDTHEAAGVEMVRTTSASITDDITNYEACGKFDKAFICCATALDSIDSKNDSNNYIEYAMKCLANQGDYLRLYEKSKQIVSDYSNSSRSALPYTIEAAWKLSKWDDLRDLVRDEQVEKMLDIVPVGQGYLLKSLVDSNEDLSDKLKIVRHQLMAPLSIAMIDQSSYFRGYQNLVALHSLSDLELAMNLLLSEDKKMPLDENKIEDYRHNLNIKLDNLLGLWKMRNKLIHPSMRNLEPIYEWQRAICLVSSSRFPLIGDRLTIEVGKMWLDSAEVAREARNFDRAFSCLTQSLRWFGDKFDQLQLPIRVKYHVIHSKVDWDQGDKTKAIRSLKLALQRLKNHPLYEHLNVRQTKRLTAKDPFPQLNPIIKCTVCGDSDVSDRESFVTIKMLLTQYSEEAAAEIPEKLFFMHEECVHLSVQQEETYFRLARYYDKLLTYYTDNPQLCEGQQDRNLFHDSTQRFSQTLMTGDREDMYTKLMEHCIMAFGNSLKFGVRYLRESMPRMLNIWYDLGSKKTRVNQTCSRALSSRIESTIRFIDELKNKYLPPYFFITAISLMLTRVTHPHSGVSKKTQEIVELLMCTYPHQISWYLMPLINDKENEDRRRAAKSIWAGLKKKANPQVLAIVNNCQAFTVTFIELSQAHGPDDRTRSVYQKKKLQGDVNIEQLSIKAANFDFNKFKIMVPNLNSMRAILPTDNTGDLKKYPVFPGENISFITSLETKVKIFNSVQRPKQLNFICDNGKRVSILAKCGDDLRKDSRCMEFLELLNSILRRDRQSNVRYMDVATYLVTPLNSTVGLIEMYPHCQTMRSCVEPVYKERNVNWTPNVQYPAKDKQPMDRFEIFKTVVLPKASPPALPIWYLRNFVDPTSWYMARLAFTRSSSVISMGGYIIGLGDRHLENVLVEVYTGRVVHVDFNLLFHQGETLPCPELVPFRLTQNIIAAFGSLGVDGNFRRCSEIAMRVMRKQKESLLTTLRPLIHDPCTDWIKVRDSRGNRADMEDMEDRLAGNKSAQYRIEVTERKLKGLPRSNKFKPLTLIDSYSVEAQVENLIEEAKDLFNLSQMYYGWAPHV